ncbi:MAG: hypothetical protein WD595_03865 [Waddliaceae bacterium]
MTTCSICSRFESAPPYAVYCNQDAEFSSFQGDGHPGIEQFVLINGDSRLSAIGRSD